MKRPSYHFAMKAQYLTLILPGLILFTVGLILPMFLALGYSFTSWDGYARNFPFVGFDNFIKIFQDPNTLQAWWFTIQFTFWNTLIQNVLALFFAVILDTGLKAKTFYRTVLFLPCLVAPVVAGFIWQHMYWDVLPGLNSIFGTKIDFGLFGSPDTVLTGILVANNWQFIGYWMLIYLAALQSIPVELYESAVVDGASIWVQFTKITIPMLAPAFTICIVGITAGSLRIYDLLVSATMGGPGRASTSIIYHIFNTAISAQQYGYGSALSMSLIIVLLLIALAQLGYLKKKEIQL